VVRGWGGGAGGGEGGIRDHHDGIIMIAYQQHMCIASCCTKQSLSWVLDSQSGKVRTPL
jgi:hypothetical protein